jgi:hypothetical protein
MAEKKPTVFSIALADSTAVGHINAGLKLYTAFEALPKEERKPGEQLDFGRTIQLAVPAVTNFALGLELLLKVHHFQLTGKYPKGHDVSQLGNDFATDVLDRLREHYREMYEDPTIPKGLEFRFSGGSSGRSKGEWATCDFPTYDSAINYLGPMYSRWRYIYEEWEEDFDINVSFMPLYYAAMSVHKGIRTFEGGTKITLNDGARDA